MTKPSPRTTNGLGSIEVRGAVRLEHQHAGRVVVGDLDVERREQRRLAVAAGRIGVGDRASGVVPAFSEIAQLDVAGTGVDTSTLRTSLAQAALSVAPVIVPVPVPPLTLVNLAV